jgi:hypothetical protein
VTTAATAKSKTAMLELVQSRRRRDVRASLEPRATAEAILRMSKAAAEHEALPEEAACSERDAAYRRLAER